MVKALVRVSILAFGAVLTGCPDDVGQDIHPQAGLIAPRSLQGWANSGLEVELAWVDASTTESGYRLEIGDGPFGLTPHIDTVLLPAGSTRFLYSCLPAHAYYFRLYAVTETMQSEPSEEIVVITPAIVPGTPSILSLSGDWSTIIVQWTNVEGETGYQIELSQDGSVWTPLAPIIPADVTAAGFAPTPGVKKYWVRIYAIGPYANSPRSSAWFLQLP